MKKQAFCIAFLIVFAAAAFAQNGVITELSGTVELKPAGAADWTHAQKGDKIAANTIVSTGFKSSAVITTGSATIVVRPLTRLSLTEIAKVQDTETVNVNLSAGRVKIDVKPPSGMRADFKVTSPTATASVRGTSFDLDTRNLRVSNGTVAYQGSRGAPVPVTAGGESRVNAATGSVVIPMEVQAAALLPPQPVAGPPGGGPAGGTMSPMREPSTGGPAAPSGGGQTPGFGIGINVSY